MNATVWAEWLRKDVTFFTLVQLHRSCSLFHWCVSRAFARLSQDDKGDIAVTPVSSQQASRESLRDAGRQPAVAMPTTKETSAASTGSHGNQAAPAPVPPGRILFVKLPKF